MAPAKVRRVIAKQSFGQQKKQEWIASSLRSSQ
jgi:hypothetical protein